MLLYCGDKKKSGIEISPKNLKCYDNKAAFSIVRKVVRSRSIEPNKSAKFVFSSLEKYFDCDRTIFCPPQINITAIDNRILYITA